MVGRGPRFAIERAEIGNSRPTVVRACALLDLRLTLALDPLPICSDSKTSAAVLKNIGQSKLIFGENIADVLLTFGKNVLRFA